MMQWSDEALRLTGEFVATAGCKRRLSANQVAIAQWLWPELGSIYARVPDVERVIQLLSNTRRGCGDDKDVLMELSFVHYCAMREYVLCPIAGPQQYDDQARYLDATIKGKRDIMADALRALPVAPRLREAMWRSLWLWRELYSERCQSLIGEFLVAVHLCRTQRTNRITRPDFIMACLWNKGASWIFRAKEVYRHTQSPKWDDLREAVAWSGQNGVSIIRYLARSQCELPQVPWSETWEGDEGDECGMVLDAVHDGATFDSEAEATVNESLLSVVLSDE